MNNDWVLWAILIIGILSGITFGLANFLLCIVIICVGLDDPWVYNSNYEDQNADNLAR